MHACNCLLLNQPAPTHPTSLHARTHTTHIKGVDEVHLAVGHTVCAQDSTRKDGSSSPPDSAFNRIPGDALQNRALQQGADVVQAPRAHLEQSSSNRVRNRAGTGSR